jgi:hypothetical protein
MASYGSGEVAFSALDNAQIAAKASKQVARATAGYKLGSYLQAADLSTFWYAPTSVTTAYYKSAYWLAVAAQLGGQGLASAAAASLYKGANPIISAGSYFLSSPIDIVKDAGNKIAAVAGSNKQLQAVAKILGVQSTMVTAAQARAYEQSTPGILADTVGGMKRPSTWPKWLIPLVIGIPLAVLTLYLLGMTGKAKRIAADVQRRAKAAVAAAST